MRAGAGREVPAWLLTLQAVHHANDHRAQVGTVLGANGLPAPEIDVWTFAGAPGQEAGSQTPARGS